MPSTAEFFPAVILVKRSLNTALQKFVKIMPLRVNFDGNIYMRSTFQCRDRK